MLYRGILVFILTSSLLADDSFPESVVERPLSSEDEAASSEDSHLEAGGEASGTRQSRQLDTQLSGRQGPLPGMDVVTMTVNALNPVPYLIGGLNGVRGVMRQRFFPWRGMMINNFQRTVPRPPDLRFRGGDGSGRGTHLGHPAQNSNGVVNGGGLPLQNSNGVGGSNGDERFRDGGSGGGSFRGSKDSLRENGGFGRGARPGQNFKHIPDDINMLMTDDPLGSMHQHQQENSLSGFDTPKPHSILNSATPASFRTIRRPRPAHNTQRPRTTVSTTRARPIVSSLRPDTVRTSNKNFPHKKIPTQNDATDSNFNHTPSADKKKVIIEIPKELQDLAVLEVSMHSNGDVSIGPGNIVNSKSTPAPPQLPPITPTSKSSHTPSAFLPLFPPFLPGMNEHGFVHNGNPEIRTSNPVDIHHGFNTNQNVQTDPKSSILCVTTRRDGRVNSIQDILRMQNLENTNHLANNDFNFELNCIKNQQPSSLKSQFHTFGNEQVPVHLPRSLLRENQVPHYSANFSPDKQNINHIYFVPISMPLSPVSSNTQMQSGSAHVPQHVKTKSQINNDESSVYYIDITIPGNKQDDPVITTKYARKRRSLQFDGWYPMDVSNPMSDDPTIGYQPPPLERVHFSDDPVNKNPMFPVKPKNPTVFVVRAEPQETEYHSVYGTENIEYFHIHPKSNTIRAFRAPSQSVGAIQFVSAPQFGETGENQQNNDYLSSSDAKLGVKRESFYQDMPDKELGFSDKSDDFGDTDYDQDMEGSFSEYSIIARPYQLRNREQLNPHGFRYAQDSSTRRRQDFVDLPQRESENRRSSRPALYELLGNFKYESQIEETPYLGSATDSAKETIYREAPPEFFQNRPFRKNNIPRSGPRGPTYRQTGLDADESSSRPWYLIDTKSERRREPSIASYIHTETRLGDERVHYKPLGPVSYVSKDAQKERVPDPFYNPHLDDHMNSYKPSTSLTANSLSELLQIFRFTQVTDKPGRGVTEEPITFVREFRYTRPTEETPTTYPTYDDNFPSNSRYTSTPDSISERDSISVTANIDIATEPSKKVQYDAVADTNSLDGYLFSDSEASPEYAHPEVKPNIIIIDGKNLESPKTPVKDDTNTRELPSSSVNPLHAHHSLATPKKPEPDFENLEIIYPGPTPKTTASTRSSWPLYIIHQGHSKVRVFGINSAADKPTRFNIVPANETSTSTITPSSNSSFLPDTTTTDTLTTTPFLLDHNGTTESTSTVTTISFSTPKVVDYDITPKDRSEEYDYYYYDESNTSSDMAFGEEYFTEKSDESYLGAPGSENPYLTPSYRLLSGDLDTAQDRVTFSRIFQDRLPRAESFAKSDQIPLLPAVALKRDQLSVARPVFFTKRERKSEVTENNASVSQPFEYLSHLSQLSRERRSTNSKAKSDRVESEQDLEAIQA